MSSTVPSFPVAPGWRRWLPAMALAFSALGASAQQASAEDPPGRVAAVTERQGSVVFAAAGEEEWAALPQNRPLTQADRLWTDQGGKVELHLGAATVHVRERTNLGIVELDDRAAHLSMTQGALNARVRELESGERFEVGTPNLSARASQPGDFRIDVDPDTASTRVAVHSGTVTVYGHDGKGRVLAAGDDVIFVARDLEQVEPHARAADAFDQWAAARNQREDQSQTAKIIPRDVVGYPQLDNNGTWSQDTTYGPVWYPNVAANVEWAPYRQGRWEYIQPWGWTWIDDAPWGFAPFHYGRWAMIGSRWAWVPGSMGPRPVYAPALVQFVGGGATFTVANSPGIAWYPLAPGEAWRPGYRASTVYVRNVNRGVYVAPSGGTFYANSRYANAITSLRLEDFNRGRAVWGNWHRVDPVRVAGATVIQTPARPNWTRWDRRDTTPAPRLVQTPPPVNAVTGVPRWGRDWRTPGTDTRVTTTPRTTTDTRVTTTPRTTDTRVTTNVPPATVAAPTPTVPATVVPPRTAPRPDWERDQARLITGSTPQGRVELTAQDKFYRDQREQQARQQQAREQQARAESARRQQDGAARQQREAARQQQWQQQQQVQYQQRVEQQQLVQRRQRVEDQQQAQQWQRWQQRQQQVQAVAAPQRQVVPQQPAQVQQAPQERGQHRGWRGQEQGGHSQEEGRGRWNR